VRILLDEQMPRRLARHLTGHEVRTVQQCGWAGLRNGALLMRAAAGFDIFITGDRNLEHQQNLSGSPLCVLVLRGRSNRFRDVLELLPSLMRAVDEARPGTVIRVNA
jgi:predicted nuclease of predicted toxin-antitoxin system